MFIFKEIYVSHCWMTQEERIMTEWRQEKCVKHKLWIQDQGRIPDKSHLHTCYVCYNIDKELEMFRSWRQSWKYFCRCDSECPRHWQQRLCWQVSFLDNLFSTKVWQIFPEPRRWTWMPQVLPRAANCKMVVVMHT